MQYSRLTWNPFHAKKPLPKQLVRIEKLPPSNMIAECQKISSPKGRDPETMTTMLPHDNCQLTGGDNDLSNGPVTKRSCTDCWCLIVLLAAWMAYVVVTLAGPPPTFCTRVDQVPNFWQDFKTESLPSCTCPGTIAVRTATWRPIGTMDQTSKVMVSDVSCGLNGRATIGCRGFEFLSYTMYLI